MSVRVWGLGLLALLGGCSTEIHHGLSEEGANALMVILDEEGIAATKRLEKGKEGNRWTIVVPQSEARAAWRVLRSKGEPREEEAGVREIFGARSLVPSAEEEQALFALALAGELARTLERVDGVVDARVHIVMPRPRAMLLSGGAPPAPSASVLVKAERREPPPLTVEDVQRLVAGSVEGLASSGVEVVMVQASLPVGPGDEGVVPLGPWSVSSASLGSLRLTLLALVLALMILGSTLALIFLRMQRLRKVLGRP